MCDMMGDDDDGGRTSWLGWVFPVMMVVMAMVVMVMMIRLLPLVWSALLSLVLRGGGMSWWDDGERREL